MQFIFIRSHKKKKTAIISEQNVLISDEKIFVIINSVSFLKEDYSLTLRGKGENCCDFQRPSLNSKYSLFYFLSAFAKIPLYRKILITIDSL